MSMDLADIETRLQEAVRVFWRTRQSQARKQRAGGTADQGARSAVTGGKQMDGFVRLLADLIVRAGVADASVHRHRRIELPGYFRPTKQWDLLVVANGHLLAALELKSHVGSFGNNFNNRTEEAMGSALDLWTAYREGAFGQSPRPWLGYLILLEDCDRARAPVAVQEPHFPVFPEFRQASYTRRYEEFCRRLMRERHYDSAALLASSIGDGRTGRYSEPSPDLAFRHLAASIMGRMATYAATRES